MLYAFFTAFPKQNFAYDLELSRDPQELSVLFAQVHIGLLKGALRLDSVQEKLDASSKK